MTLEGHVENGQIVLDEPVHLPEGIKVRVEVLDNLPQGPGKPSLYDRLKPIEGILDDLSDDAALNHDHYLYGVPKQS